MPSLLPRPRYGPEQSLRYYLTFGGLINPEQNRLKQNVLCPYFESENEQLFIRIHLHLVILRIPQVDYQNSNSFSFESAHIEDSDSNYQPRFQC